MTSTRSHTGNPPSFSIYEDGAPLEKQQPRDQTVNIFAIPPQLPEAETRSSKVRRHGSKFMDALRTLTNSASSSSVVESLCRSQPPSCLNDASPMLSVPPTTARKLSMALLTSNPTVIHRAQFKSRPNLLSLDKGVLDSAVAADGSPSTSLSSTGKSSTALRVESTGKTSLDSKFSMNSKGISQHSSEHKKLAEKKLAEHGGSTENPLTSIAEIDLQDPEPVPTVVTVERAAAAKIFFECHYNKITSNELTPRSLRRLRLESALCENITSSAAEKDNIRRAWAMQETNHLRETRAMRVRGTSALKGKDITSSSFETIKILGKGSFGVVRLVREKSENSTEKQKEIYAMKVIRKSDMLRNSQEGHLRAERDFLVSAEGSQWVVPLIASFQDLNNLYLVMEYMPGGDFLGLLIRDNVLSEPVARFYVAEMILCIEEAHALRWIHRDVKPDNFLISASGHLTISDFGLAFDGHWSHDQAYFSNHRYSLLTKLGINVEGDSIDKKEGRSIAAAMKIAQVLAGTKERHELKSSEASESEGILNWRNRNGIRTLARSVVGTSQYMAPEVVRGELYDARCDWWSVAVILYECLYGHTPFLAEEGGRQQTKLNILDHKTTFSFPSKPAVSRRCQDLIRSIIQEKDHRLCSRRYKSKDHAASSRRNQDHAGRCVYPDDAEEIKAHKWFRDIQWDRIHTMTPPFVPNIKSTDDTHYFDEEDSISDFSASASKAQPTTEEVADALKKFNRELQILATGFIERPYDSIRLRKAEKEIDAVNVSDDQKNYLKEFVKRYGRKEKKRPRDRLLRDRDLASKVLELRKRGAFLGYTYRRIRTGKVDLGKTGVSGISAAVVAGSPGKRNGWHRVRLSIH